MPFYTQICNTCGTTDDVFRSVSEYKICATCGKDCEIKIAATPTLGIVWSNMETNAQIGQRWETNAQKRAWFEKHPNARPMDVGSQEEKSFRNNLADQADQAAKKKGYRDVAHFKKVNRAIDAREKAAKKASLRKS
tara:strand:- start:320 stop:727 length:408 start_codon:yes stop_codon:yes gene_type:complete